MKLHHLISTALLVASGFNFAHGAELAGKWASEFESQIGTQKYTYTFKTEGGKTTGKATFDHQMGKGENELKDIKVEKDDVSFTEPLHINDMDLIITYKGKLSDDEMKLTRVVGDFATEEIVAKRVKSEAKTEEKPAPKK